MTSTAAKKKPIRIDSLMEKASAALVEGDYFACERLSQEALELAYQCSDFERMARIILPLQESRRQRRMAAIDSGKLIRVSEEMPEHLEPACYLIEPRLVGANGRDLRDRANVERVPVYVIVREPATQLGEWPIVMIGPITVRAKVDRPENDEPTIEWLLAAGEALGDEAIARIDPEASPIRRMENLLDFLGTVVDHELLHQELEAACREAAKEAAAEK